MPLAIHEGRTIFFAHVPKTGGTTVEDYLIRRFGPLCILDKHKRDDVPGTGLMTSATHLSALDLEELLPPTLDYAFTMVRDPVARLKSEYRYQSGSSRTSRWSFSTWLVVMLACLRIERRVYDNHIRPQSELVPEGAEVFKLEKEGMRKMIARLDEVTGQAAPGVTIEDLNESRKKADITLSRQDAERIAEAYAADYDRFGYAAPDTDGLASDPRAGGRAAFARSVAPVIVARQRRRWLR